MELMCKCGKIEDIRTNINSENYKFRCCDDGRSIIVCKKYNEVLFRRLKDSYEDLQETGALFF